MIAKDKYVNRVCIGTPTTGLVRMEWVNARFGQTIPTNWSHVDVQQWMSPWVPLGFQVADAENLIAKAVVEQDFEWLLFIEHDNVLPPKALLKINDYMLKGDIPVVGGLYFTKSVPPEPMIYRDRGRGYYTDWKLGDKVWAQGIPFGFTLIHGDIIRELWKDSPEYVVNGTITRRVFHAPNEVNLDPESQGMWSEMGTSDLAWCKRVKEGNYFAKAGFPKIQAKENPFLIDTTIFVKHITEKGEIFPLALPKDFVNGKITYREALKQLTDSPIV